ncbi:MAG: hypothetical protein ACREOB_04130 [Thermodesulfobacteriota bacterium]
MTNCGTCDSSGQEFCPIHRDVTIDFFPLIVVLCGSTRFKNEFEEEMRELTLEGYIVISVGLFGHIEGLDMGTDLNPTLIKQQLDELHMRKIDLADRVHIINVGGYIGTSTSKEIAYAQKNGKLITYKEV